MMQKSMPQYESNLEVVDEFHESNMATLALMLGLHVYLGCPCMNEDLTPPPSLGPDVLDANEVIDEHSDMRRCWLAIIAPVGVGVD